MRTAFWLCTLIVSLLLAPQMASAQGPGLPPIPGAQMWVMTEWNSNTVQLSSGRPIPGTNLTMPQNIWAVLGASCRYDGGKPYTYALVEYTANPSGYLVFSETSTRTDHRGKGRVAVRANNTVNIPDKTKVTVTAHWKNNYGQLVKQQNMTVTLRTYAPSGGYPPFWTTKPHASRPVIVYYDDPSLGKCSGAAISARSAWSVPNRIVYQSTSVKSQADHRFESIFSRGRTGDFAMTFSHPTLPSITSFNLATLDGGYWDSEIDMGPITSRLDAPNILPIEWRQHLRATAVHEVGHALGLGPSNQHSGPDRYDSCMAPHIQRYHVGGTVNPGPGDWSLILPNYP